MEKQKDIFLHSEGNAWFERNEKALKKKTLPDDDPVLLELLDMFELGMSGLSILEIGCGDGSRIAWLKEYANADCYGIDPSTKAVESALEKGVNVLQGTADSIPFENNKFDVVIFGFCLYLCDREDLFRISQEADRVLRNPSWLVIMDFFSTIPKDREYHHYKGVLSHKMDYRQLFSWHPSYECLTHKVRSHVDSKYTKDVDDWVSISVLLKS